MYYCKHAYKACTCDHRVASKVKIGLYHYAWTSNRTFCLGKCHNIQEFTHLMEVSHLMNAMSTDAIYNIAGVKNISKISSAKAAWGINYKMIAITVLIRSNCC